jgi:hypothetical protein
MSTKKWVLGDHHQEGKKFHPPLTHLLGTITEIDYINRILPEIARIQFLNEGLGVRRGISASIALLKTLASIKDRDERRSFRISH